MSSTGSSSGCPPEGTIDPGSGLPVAKDCGLDGGHPGSGGASPCGTCDDGNPCTSDVCDGVAGVCAHAFQPTDTACGDGYCNPEDGTCCAGCFVVEVGTKSLTCVEACPVGAMCSHGTCVFGL